MNSSLRKTHKKVRLQFLLIFQFFLKNLFRGNLKEIGKSIKRGNGTQVIRLTYEQHFFFFKYKL